MEGWIVEPYLELQPPKDDALNELTGKIPNKTVNREAVRDAFLSQTSPRWNGKNYFPLRIQSEAHSHAALVSEFTLVVGPETDRV